MPNSEDNKASLAIAHERIDQLTICHKENLEAQKENLKAITDLVTQMKIKEVKDSAYQKDIIELKKEAVRFIDEDRPVIRRARKEQERSDRRYETVTSNWFKMASTAAATALVAGFLIMINK